MFKNLEPFNNRREINFINKIILKLILHLIFIFVFFIFKIFKVRIINSSTEAIGHQIMDLTYLSNKKIKYKIILPIHKKFIGNIHFFNFFQKSNNFLTINNYFLCMILFYLKKYKSICYDVLHVSTKDNSIIYKFFEKIKKPLFKNEIELEGRKILKKKKIILNKKFVCLHIRNSYLKKFDKEEFRNAKYKNYIKCINWLIKKKYTIIILGANKSNNYNFKSKAVINLPKLNFSNKDKEILDIFFSANCEFFIGTQSGLQYLPAFFHRPVLITNVVPINHGYPIISNGLFIPKLCKKDFKILNLKEIIESNAYYSRSGIYFKKLKFQFIDNTPDEILNAVNYLIRMNKNKKFGDKTKLQKVFRKKIENLKFKYSVYSKSTICNEFLKKHKKLFI